MTIENKFNNSQGLREPSEMSASEKNKVENVSDYKKERDNFFAAIHRHEMPLNEKQLSILETAAKDVGDVLKEYGFLLDTEKVLSHIHLVSPGFFKETALDEDAEGAYVSRFGKIILKHKLNETNSIFANKITHEILHFFQFDNRKKAKGEESLDQESLGMMIKGENKILFESLLEAVTQKLTNQIMKRNKNPDIIHENEKLKQIFKKNPNENYILGLGKLKGYLIPFKPIQIYKKNLQKFDEMLQEIQKNNTDRFNTAEEVFKIFVEAAFSNRKLPMFRLIEKTYGTKNETLKAIRKIFGKKSGIRDIARKWSKI